MKIRNIQTILAVAILTLILTSNVQATECLRADQTNRAIEEIKAAFEVGGYIRTSGNSGKSDQTQQQWLVAPTKDSSFIAALTSEGYITGSPVKSFNEVERVGFGKVVLLNKCFAISVAHNLMNIRLQKQKHGVGGELAFYGSFGVGTDSNDEFAHSSVKLSVAHEGDNVVDIAVLRVENPAVLEKVEFPKPFKGSVNEQVKKVLITRFPRGSVKETFGARATELLSVNLNMENKSKSLIAMQHQKDGHGGSGGAIWIPVGSERDPQSSEMRIAGIRIGPEVAYSMRMIFQEVGKSNPSLGAEIIKSFDDPRCARQRTAL